MYNITFQERQIENTEVSPANKMSDIKQGKRVREHIQTQQGKQKIYTNGQ